MRVRVSQRAPNLFDARATLAHDNPVITRQRHSPMKYGIKATYPDGRVQYAYEAKHRLTLTDDITSSALFVQEASAAKALRAARKEGYESRLGCVLSVMEITYAIVRDVEVSPPKKPEGYLVTDGEKYYSGTKKDSGWYGGLDWHQAIESATYFKTMEQASSKIHQVQEEYRRAVQQYTDEVARGSKQYYAFGNEHLNAAKLNLEKANNSLDWALNNLYVVNGNDIG